MKKYVYQKFLLNCNYEGIEIEAFPSFTGNIENVQDYRCDYDLFDVGEPVIRKINVADIDEQIDTEEEWGQLLRELQEFDVVVLYNYNSGSENPIIKSYRNATLKAYLYRLQEKGLNICLAGSKGTEAVPLGECTQL